MNLEVKRILRLRLYKQALHPALITGGIGAAVGAGLGGYKAYKKGGSILGGMGKGALAGGAIGGAVGVAGPAALAVTAPMLGSADAGTGTQH